MALSAAASLKLDQVLGLMLRQFKLRLAPLRAFSTVLQARTLPTGQALQVPYIPIEALASKDFDEDVGYEDGDFAVETRPVTPNKRKYQVLSFTSAELKGLPAEYLAEGMIQKVDKLAGDVVTDVLSVVTLSNYGAAIHTGLAANFDTDDVADMDTAVSDAHWPTVGRSLVLDSTYTNSLKKDDSLKDAAQSGSNATLREGTIGRVSSFDTYEVPGLPANGEYLKGFAALKYGILVASAPVEPSDEVKDQLTDYREVTDETTGLTLIYRAWGNPDLDKAKRIVEFSYGYAKGDAAQIKRVCSQ